MELEGKDESIGTKVTFLSLFYLIIYVPFYQVSSMILTFSLCFILFLL